MTDDELIRELDHLGIRGDHVRLVAMIPLLQVAWADGQIQKPERRHILKHAEAFGVHDEYSQGLLESWLTDEPSPAFFARGRRLLVTLAGRHRGLGSDFPPNTITQIESLCLEVAQAAGGLFNRVFTVTPEERTALAQIAAHLASEQWSAEEQLPGQQHEDL